MNSSSTIAVPSAIPAAVSILPLDLRVPAIEILFDSRCIALMLARLKPGQRLHREELCQCLLTVAQGQVRLHGPNGSFTLNKHGRWRLECGECWKIQAMTDVCVSLLIVKAAH